jgi:hypothetical protein
MKHTDELDNRKDHVLEAVSKALKAIMHDDYELVQRHLNEALLISKSVTEVQLKNSLTITRADNHG